MKLTASMNRAHVHSGHIYILGTWHNTTNTSTQHTDTVKTCLGSSDRKSRRHTRTAQSPHTCRHSDTLERTSSLQKPSIQAPTHAPLTLTKFALKVRFTHALSFTIATETVLGRTRGVARVAGAVGLIEARRTRARAVAPGHAAVQATVHRPVALAARSKAVGPANTLAIASTPHRVRRLLTQFRARLAYHTCVILFFYTRLFNRLVISCTSRSLIHVSSFATYIGSGRR